MRAPLRSARRSANSVATGSVAAAPSATAPLRFAPARQFHRSAAVAPLPCCASPARVNCPPARMVATLGNFQARCARRIRASLSLLALRAAVLASLRSSATRALCSLRSTVHQCSLRSQVVSVAGRKTRRFAPRCKLALTRSVLAHGHHVLREHGSFTARCSCVATRSVLFADLTPPGQR